MNMLLRRPFVCLTGLGLAALVVAWGRHGFQPQTQPDTHTYLEFDWSSLATVLSNVRTWGYPLFVDCVGTLSSNPRAIPLAQWCLWIAAGLAFLRGLTCVGFRRPIAVWATGTLWLGNAAMLLTPELLSDSLGCSLAVIAVGCFLATLTPQRTIGDWIGLALATAAAYLVRPVYLGLIPLWAIVAIASRRGGVPTIDTSTSGLRTWGRYLAITLIPFAAYCTLRWAVVGHWGLVSFGGYNSVAIAAQFLEPADLPHLPDEVRPVAEEILRRLHDAPDVAPLSSYDEMERNYVRLQYPVILSAAADVLGDNPVVVNARLTTLSQELFLRHPRQYARWLVWDARHAVKQTLLLTISDPAVLGLLAMCVLIHAVSYFRGSPRRDAGLHAVDRAVARWIERHILFWLAIAFAGSQTALIILVQPAIGRYMLGATVLIPPALAVLVVHYAESVFSSCQDAALKSPVDPATPGRVA